MNRLFQLGAIAALALLSMLQLLALLLAPAAWLPQHVDVRLRPGESVLLGRAELAAPQADATHLLVRRDAAGRWYAQNASAAKQLLLERGGREHAAASTALQPGQALLIGATGFTVGTAGTALELRSAEGNWRYDGSTVTRNGKPQPPCPGASLATRAAGLWNRWAPNLLRGGRALTFGGNLYCGNRIGIAGAEAGSASIRFAQGAFMLQAPPAVALLVTDAGGSWLLGRRDEALAGTTALTVGHTRLAIAIEAGRLRLTPSGHVMLLPSARVELPPQVSWQLQARGLWGVPVAAATLASCAGVALLLAGASGWLAARRTGRANTVLPVAAGVLLALGGPALLSMQRSGAAPGAGIAVLLGACTAWHLMLGTGRLRLLPVAAALLLAIGLLAQLELGLGANDSAALRYVTRTAALAAMGLGLVPLLRCAAPRAPSRQAVVEWLLLGAAGVALFALLLQATMGDETGVFDLQPVEFAKLALIALTAHCLALAGSATTSAPASLPAWLRMLAPAVLFVALLAVALVQVDDYSPLVLLLVWAAAMTFAWTLASGSRRWPAAIAALACTAAVGVAAIQQEAPARVGALQFYGDRFQVWLDPEAHPHTGQQVLRAAAAIGSGGTWGADRALGLATLGQQAGDALRIPAVQDDFAAAFFLYRHGIAAGIALWLLQALFVAALAQLAQRSWQASLAARDFRSAWFARLRCFALAGGAAFVSGHLLLAWGTNLGVLPVMGQPMSFLSAGGSHLLFFICPLLVFAMASAESIEENESCRSTFNMKPLAK